ncbi:MAG: substrate-binding protein [bacterium]
MKVKIFILSLTFLLVASIPINATVKIGLNYPETGPYAAQGLDQIRAAKLAVEEINSSGGILGQPIELIIRDSKSKPDITRSNITELIDKHGVKMVFGGSSSEVAIVSAEICQNKGIPFFGTLTYSPSTTGTAGHRYTFRECYDSWMAVKALAYYLNKDFRGKKYFYITADYAWGWNTEESFRKLTGTINATKHPGVKTKFPGANRADFETALNTAQSAHPDVLVLVLFGYDMGEAAKIAQEKGMKNTMQIIVPNLTLGMADAAGPEAMEGIIGASPWCWQVPYKYDYTRGKEFVKKYVTKYQRYPSCSGGSAYTILHEYKAAVERAKGFDPPQIIRVLEGYRYQMLKDPQVWRAFDHQSTQTVYVLQCKPAVQVRQDQYELDYFEILSHTPGSKTAITRLEWIELRKKIGKPLELEKLPGEL